MPFLIPFDRPETAGVGGEHFIRENDIPVLVETEFKLRVSDDYAAAEGIVSTSFIKGDGGVTDDGRILLSFSGESLFQDLDAPLEGDILVVIPDFRLCARRIDGFGKL